MAPRLTELARSAREGQPEMPGPRREPGGLPSHWDASSTAVSPGDHTEHADAYSADFPDTVPLLGLRIQDESPDGLTWGGLLP